MAYQLVVTSAARRGLKSLPRPVAERIVARILALTDKPRPVDVKKLRVPGNMYRIRVGDYRIVYQILDREVVVIVVRIGHRREVDRDG